MWRALVVTYSFALFPPRNCSFKVGKSFSLHHMYTRCDILFQLFKKLYDVYIVVYWNPRLVFHGCTVPSNVNILDLFILVTFPQVQPNISDPSVWPVRFERWKIHSLILFRSSKPPNPQISSQILLLFWSPTAHSSVSTQHQQRVTTTFADFIVLLGTREILELWSTCQ